MPSANQVPVANTVPVSLATPITAALEASAAESCKFTHAEVWPSPCLADNSTWARKVPAGYDPRTKFP